VQVAAGVLRGRLARNRGVRAGRLGIADESPGEDRSDDAKADQEPGGAGDEGPPAAKHVADPAQR